jgi:hypothetical protein
MSPPEFTTEQVIELVKQLPREGKYAVLSLLKTELKSELLVLDAETQEWLDADLGAELPAYDWGAGGIPQGQPVRYVPGVGLVVEEGNSVG